MLSGYGTITPACEVICSRNAIFRSMAAVVMSLQRRTMKKLNTLAMIIAAAAFASAAGAQEINNWRNAAGEVWKNAAGECWRSGAWTPATAAPGCDGAVAPAPKAAPAPAPAPAPQAAPAPAPARAPAPAPAPAPAAASKVTYAADAFFDFDKAVLKPEGKAKLDDLARSKPSIWK